VDRCKERLKNKKEHFDLTDQSVPKTPVARNDPARVEDN